jgi:hypothetical protein
MAGQSKQSIMATTARLIVRTLMNPEVFEILKADLEPHARREVENARATIRDRAGQLRDIAPLHEASRQAEFEWVLRQLEYVEELGRLGA